MANKFIMIYVALLRGINVGGNNKINMKELKGSFEKTGMQDVTTYINSGNIIFSSQLATPKIVSLLEKAIQDSFGLDIKVVIRSLDDYKKVMTALPGTWTNDKEMKSDVMFLWEAIDHKNVLKELTIKEGVDTVKYIPGTVLWSIDRKNQSKSGMQKLVGTKTYKLMTIRNVNTVRKIWELMQAI